MERWTVREASSGRYDVHINSGGPDPGGWGRFDYRHWFDIAVETVRVVHPDDIDGRTRERIECLTRGVYRGVALMRKHGERITSLVIEIPRIVLLAPDYAQRGSTHGASLVARLMDERGRKEDAFDPTWRTSAVVSLARRIADVGDDFVLPVLADALEDAGCDSPDILAHCRSAGPHSPACWVVEEILGTE